MVQIMKKLIMVAVVVKEVVVVFVVVVAMIDALEAVEVCECERRVLDLLVKWLIRRTVEVLCEQVCVIRNVSTARRA